MGTGAASPAAASRSGSEVPLSLATTANASMVAQVSRDPMPSDRVPGSFWRLAVLGRCAAMRAEWLLEPFSLQAGQEGEAGEEETMGGGRHAARPNRRRWVVPRHGLSLQMSLQLRLAMFARANTRYLF